MNEIKLQTANPVIEGATVKAVIFNPSGHVWNGSTFVAYSQADIASYAVAMTESESVAGFYSGDFPTAITTASIYTVVVYELAGATLAPTDEEIGFGTVSWDGTGEAETDTPVGDNLITLSYVLHFLPPAAASDTVKVSAMMAAASATVEAYCNRSFKETDYAEDYDLSQPSYTLVLNNYPVISLTSVTIDPYDSNPVVVVGSNYILKSHGEIVAKPTATAGTYFPATNRGVPSVRVTYSAGYATVPADVQWATAQVVQTMYGQAGTNTSKQSETIGSYSYTLRSQATNSLLLNREVVDVLGKYRNSVLIGG